MRLGIGHRAKQVLCMATLLVAGLTPVSSMPGLAADTADDERCDFDSSVSMAQTAEDLMVDRYHLGQHPVATLPHDLTWTEDPFGDRQWRQKFQQLRYVMALMYRWQGTGDKRFRDRGVDLVKSWIAANPRQGAASGSAWKDQVTAWRAMTLVCMAGMLSRRQWLEDAIELHGAVLADPDFYVKVGNHALNQDLGLLEVGCYLDRPDWQEVARRRLETFVTGAIDTQGVSDEQAIKYHHYDYDRFMVARGHLVRCGLPAPAGFERVERIPAFLAQATRPDGHYETIGDSDDRTSPVIAGTDAEYTGSLASRARRRRQPSRSTDAATRSAAPAGERASGRSATRCSSRSGMAPDCCATAMTMPGH